MHAWEYMAVVETAPCPSVISHHHLAATSPEAAAGTLPCVNLKSLYPCSLVSRPP